MRVGQLLEGVDVPDHGLAALGVELGDAVRLDVLLAGEAELLLDRELDRQAVAVPAGLAGDVVALHGPEAREDVLEDAGLDVVGAGHAVGGRRALVEHPLGPALGLLEARGEDRRARARTRARRARARAGRPGRAPGGTSAFVIGDASSGGRCCLPTEGREPRPCRRLPRYHPPWPAGARAHREPPHWGRDAGSTGLLRPLFFRRLRGDLRVALAPGLPPSPGRSVAAYAATRPHPRFSLRPVYGAPPDSGRPVFPGRGAAAR